MVKITGISKIRPSLDGDRITFACLDDANDKHVLDLSRGQAVEMLGMINHALGHPQAGGQRSAAFQTIGFEVRLSAESMGVELRLAPTQTMSYSFWLDPAQTRDLLQLLDKSVQIQLRSQTGGTSTPKNH